MYKLNEKQSHSPAFVAFMAVGAIFAIMLILVIVNVISANNYGAATEAAIKAAHKNNENILANYVQQVQEAAQVPEMAREDLSKLIKDAIGGRYGQDGSQALFQAIQEQNPSADNELYRKLQLIIESKRDEFRMGQTHLIDLKRNYEAARGEFFRGMYLQLAGYPRIDLDKYDIVSNDYATEAFSKGKEDGPIRLRPSAPASNTTPQPANN